MWKTLPFLLLAACAADSIDQNTEGGGEDETSAVESDIVGSQNMVEYNAPNGTMTFVNGDSWSDDWSHVVPLDVGSTQLVFLYSRSLGTAKVVKINTNGSWSILSSITSVSTGWDEVVATRAVGAGVNLVFYRHSDNLLKTANVTATGGFSVVASQTLPGPTVLPTHFGWDTIVSATTAGGVAGELYTYEKSSGEARMFRLNIITHLYDATATGHYTWQTTWDRIDSGDFNNDNVDDLAFYSESTGDLKIVTMNADGSMNTGTLVANTGASHGSRLTVANFAGSAFADMLLYRTDGGPTGHGRLQIWNGGTLTKSLDNTGVQSGWTHLVPRNYGLTTQGILFYSNHGPVN